MELTIAQAEICMELWMARFAPCSFGFDNCGAAISIKVCRLVSLTDAAL